MIVKSVLFNTGLIVVIAETAEKMVDRTVDECRLHHMEKTSMTVLDDEL